MSTDNRPSPNPAVPGGPWPSPMSAPDVAPGAPNGVSTDAIQGDVACRTCGYNLRGLGADGRCPECGAAVGYSLQGDWLRFMEPAWVEALRRGAESIVIGAGVVFLSVVAMLLMVPGLGPGMLLPCALGVLAGYVLVIVGWFGLTRADPSGRGEDQYGTARRLIRVALVVFVVYQVATMAVRAAGLGSFRTALAVASLAIAVVWVVGVVAQLTYVGKLARRVPELRIAARANFLKYALGLTYGSSQVLGAATEVTRGRGTLPPLEMVSFVNGLALLVFVVMYLQLIHDLGKRLGEQAAIARSTWAAALGAPPAAPGMTAA